jgi:hypothetical protein
MTQTKKPFLWKKWLCILSIVVWLGMVFGIDPTAGWWTWLVFYGSLGLAIFTGIGWLGEAVTRGEGGEFAQHRFGRWGLLSALLVIGLLLLQQSRVLLWWVGLLWLAFVLLLELILYRREVEG